MHQLLAGAAILLALAWPAPKQPHTDLAGQQVVSEVMRFRKYVMGDGMPFEACLVYRALGTPPDFPAGLDEQVRSLLQPAGDPCPGEGQRPELSNFYRRARLTSLHIAEDTAIAQLAVTRVDYNYREIYRLRRRPDGHWNTSEVSIGGVVQTHSRQP